MRRRISGNNINISTTEKKNKNQKTFGSTAAAAVAAFPKRES